MTEKFRVPMPWPCRHCGTKHETDATAESCRRDQRLVTWIAIGILVVLAVGGLGIKVAWSSYIYGDWRCAFSECRRIVP